VATLLGLGVGVGLGVDDGVGALDGGGTALDAAGGTNLGAVSWLVAQAASIAAPTRADTLTRRIRTAGC
jgi:hypothetical protein